MIRYPLSLFFFLAIGVGCSSSSWPGGSSVPALEPTDFVAGTGQVDEPRQPLAVEPEPVDETAAAEIDAPPLTEGGRTGRVPELMDNLEPGLPEDLPEVTASLGEETIAELIRLPTVTGTDRELLVHAMIGQVNAQAIFAHEVLEPEASRLQALAGQVSREQFLREAHGILFQRLRLIVRDRLVLAEAERELTEREMNMLRTMVAGHRNELIRRHGQGSPTRADNRLLETTGRGLEATLEQFRQGVILSRFRHRKMLPHVSVSRREIERFYEDNFERFNPPPKRWVHLIRVTNANAARVIERQLGEADFLEVAGNPLNRSNPDGSGLFADGVSGEVFGDARLNAALDQLQPGGQSERIELDDGFYWVFLARVEQAAPRPLDGEVQLEIARILEQRSMQYHWVRYETRLLTQGNFKNLDDMTAEVLRIAVALYAPER